MKGEARVAVAMSGGIDSAVACFLLREAGHDVMGITMAHLPQDPTSTDASRVCDRLGVPHRTMDLTQEFLEFVKEPFVSAYVSGRTPNPCIWCNVHLKFGLLMDAAKSVGCDLFATGHYARVKHDQDRTYLLRGADKAKDQSYVLYGLGQDRLRLLLFPLGDLQKDEVRQIAKRAGLFASERPESQDICFVGGSYQAYLEQAGVEASPGPIVDVSGRVLGRHQGLPFYTVGQRKGLGLASPEPVYVIDIDPRGNALVVGTRREAFSEGCYVEDLNLVASASLDGPVDGTCMVRYRGSEVPATLLPAKESGASALAEICFHEPVFAVTPGQAAVLYQGDRVFGGGVINRRIS